MIVIFGAIAELEPNLITERLRTDKRRANLEGQRIERTPLDIDREAAHRDRFILKGAMLFATWLHDPFRPTRELDLMGCGANDAESIAETFQAICGTEVPDDGVAFDIEGLTATPVREELSRAVFKLKLNAVIDGARIPIQIDNGFGEAITPRRGKG
jgi:hypothetical protein